MRAIRHQIFILLVALLTLIVSVQAQDELVYGVTIHKEGASDGYVLFAPSQTKTVYLIDYAGRIVRQWHSDNQVFAAYLLDNGHILMATIQDFFMGSTGRIEEYDWNGNLVWEFDYPDLHHDFELLPNGNILMLAWERFTAEALLAMGLKPEILTEIESNPDSLADFDGIFLDSVIEVNPTTNDVVWRWAVSDHLIQDYDENAPDYGTPADFPGKIDLNFAWRLSVDRVHLNSVDYNPERDEVLLSARYRSEIWVIDHSLTMEEAATDKGDLLYRFGNPQAPGNTENGRRQLFLQHDARWLNDNLVLTFNNGQRGLRPFSTVDSFTLPVDESGHYEMRGNTFRLPARQILYMTEARTDFFAQTLSSAAPLPEQHLLITDGPAGRIFEIDSNGEIVWEYLVPVFRVANANARSALFKAHYYAPDAVVFRGHELTTGEAVPLQIIYP